MQCSEYNPECRSQVDVDVVRRGDCTLVSELEWATYPGAMNICTMHSINTREQLNFPSVLAGLCGQCSKPASYIMSLTLPTHMQIPENPSLQIRRQRSLSPPSCVGESVHPSPQSSL